jgi:hypothetical protein
MAVAGLHYFTFIYVLHDADTFLKHNSRQTGQETARLLWKKFSQQYLTCPYPEPDKPNPYLQTLVQSYASPFSCPQVSGQSDICSLIYYMRAHCSFQNFRLIESEWKEPLIQP